jgi:hypothetical protein
MREVVRLTIAALFALSTAASAQDTTPMPSFDPRKPCDDGAEVEAATRFACMVHNNDLASRTLSFWMQALLSSDFDSADDASVEGSVERTQTLVEGSVARMQTLVDFRESVVAACPFPDLATVAEPADLAPQVECRNALLKARLIELRQRHATADLSRYGNVPSIRPERDRQAFDMAVQADTWTEACASVDAESARTIRRTKPLIAALFAPAVARGRELVEAFQGADAVDQHLESLRLIFAEGELSGRKRKRNACREFAREAIRRIENLGNP